MSTAQDEGRALRPSLEQMHASLTEAGCGQEAAVVRRCLDLILAGTPEKALAEWSANRESIEAALPVRQDW